MRFEKDQRVFIPAVIEAQHTGRTQPIYSVLALGDVPADRVLPDHPALPAVAKWLQEHFDEDKQEALLTAFAGMCGIEDKRFGYLRAVVGELIAALGAKE